MDLEKIAAELFGREHRWGAPDKRYWCLSAEDRYADKFSGPWFKYPDQDWQCADCYEDKYLSEYSEKYLLSPAGMIEVIEALRSQGHDITIATRLNGKTGCHVHLSKLPSPFSSFHEDAGWFEAPTFPEAVIQAALVTLHC